MRFTASTILTLIIASILGMSSCDDPPTGPVPFADRDFISEEFVIDRWIGNIVWGNINNSVPDSTDEFEIEFKVDSIIDDLNPIFVIDSTGDTTDVLYNRIPFYTTSMEFFDEESSQWKITSGQWIIDTLENRIRWIPDVNKAQDQRDIIYVGYASADSLYGFVSTAGYEGTWSLHRKTSSIIE